MFATALCLALLGQWTVVISHGHDGNHHILEDALYQQAQISDHRFFLQEIFTKYGHEGKMTFEGFEHLLESLGLGNIIIADHDVTAHKKDEFRSSHGTHDHSKTEAVDERQNGGRHVTTSRLTTTRGDKTLPTVTESTRYRTSSNNEANTHHSVANYTKQSSTQASTATATTSGNTASGAAGSGNIYHYSLHDAEIPELLVNISSLVEQHKELVDEPQEMVIEQCLSPREILETFGINQSSSLNPVSFLHLCPAIIYELDQGHCMFRNMHQTAHKKVATLRQWLYGLAAVLAISLCGLLSVAVIPIMQKWFYHTLLQFLIGLAVGSLSGDGLLHLMPHAMLTTDGGHGSGILLPDVAERTAVWRGFAALGGILFFFVAERLLAVLTQRRQMSIPQNSQSSTENAFYSDGKVGQKLSQHRKDSNVMELGEKEKMHMLTHASLHESSKELGGHGHGHSHEVPESISAVAWMVIMGDGLHNFCDGLAIGAAFASGVEGGISTTIAVFCHELPHELGDFAMLLRTGMSAHRALFYNVVSSVLCLAGAMVGLFLGGVSSSTGWVFAVTAGIFLYVALVDMLPELSSAEDPNFSPLHQLAIQVLGISSGVSIMLIIANYERDLQSIVS